MPEPRILLFVLLAALAPAVFAQAMEPGEWEFNSVLSGPSLPKPQTATITQCISKEDASDPTRFTSGEQTMGCTVQPGARTADSYQWSLSCPDKGVSGDGKVRFTRRTIEAEIRTTVAMEDRKVEMLSRVSGRLLGPCKTK